MTSHAETHDLIERAAHLARLGWAVEKHAARGEVEFRLTDLRDTAHALEWPDLAHACDKGGDELDGPVLLTDEPGGDAMRMTFNRDDRARWL